MLEEPMYARLTADLLTRCILAVGVTLTVAGLIHQHLSLIHI